MNIFKKIKYTLRLREATLQADNLYAQTLKRQYVIPVQYSNGKLIILNTKQFKQLKRKGMFPQLATTNDLQAECFYCTPYANGDGQLTPEQRKAKQQEYFNYIEHEQKTINK